MVTVLACFCAAVAWFDLLGPAGDIFRLKRISYGQASSVAFAMGRLDSHDPLVQREAISALGRIGPSARSAVSRLIEILAEDKLTDSLVDSGPTDHADVSWATFTTSSNAAWAIGNIGPTDAVASTALKDALKSKNRYTREYAAYAISRHGGTVASAIPELIAALDDDHVAFLAARALGEMGRPGVVAIPKLTKLLALTNDARAESATALSSLSAYSQLPDETMLKLNELRNDPEEYVRKAASDAIALIETYQLDATSSVTPVDAPKTS